MDRRVSSHLAPAPAPAAVVPTLPIKAASAVLFTCGVLIATPGAVTFTFQPSGALPHMAAVMSRILLIFAVPLFIASIAAWRSGPRVHVLTAVVAGVYAVPLGAAWVGVTALQLVRVGTGLDGTYEVSALWVIHTLMAVGLAYTFYVFLRRLR